LNLPPSRILAEYPFSVKVDKKIHMRDIFRAMRDHYEGTQWDLTKGFGAGPYGDPNRFGGVPPGVTSNLTRRGNFDRPTSVHAVAYHYVAQSRSWLPPSFAGRVFFSPHSPHSGTPTVIYPSTSRLPAPLHTGSLYRFNLNSTWWLFCAVTNYVQRAWVHLYPEVEKVREDLENYVFTNSEEIETALLPYAEREETVAIGQILTAWQDANAQAVLSNWTELFFSLITKFHDGALVDDLHAKDITYTPKPWPLWWLEQAGYFKLADEDQEPLTIPLHTDDAPFHLSSYPQSLSLILAGHPSSLFQTSSLPSSFSSSSIWIHFDLIGLTIFSFLLLLVGVYIGANFSKKNDRRKSYEDLD